MSVFLKDPGARLDYAVDWTQAADGHAVVDSEWSVAPIEAGGVTIEAEALSGPRAAVTLAGGRAGCVYRLGNTVTLADGRRDVRVLTLRIDAR